MPMPGEPFADLLRRLTRPTTRRRTLAAVSGGLAFAGGRAETAAACVAIGGTCKSANGQAKQCCGGAKCKRKRCRCVSPKENSGGVCAKRPRCRVYLAHCENSRQCCSNYCISENQVCLSPLPGQRCQTDGDCASATPKCVGFKCRT